MISHLLKTRLTFTVMHARVKVNQSLQKAGAWLWCYAKPLAWGVVAMITLLWLKTIVEVLFWLFSSHV